MLSTVKLFEHFNRLLDFKGREDRASFWPYAAVVYGIMMVGSFAVMIPAMESAIPAANEITTQNGSAPFPAMGSFFVGIMIVTAIGVLLYAAAAVRRLHDAGFSGLWALMPLPFLAFGLIGMWGFFESFSAQPDMSRFNEIFLNNLVYILTLIALIVLLSRKSDAGPNRFDTHQ